MRSKNKYNFVIIFSLVLFLSIGYAVVNSVSLSITGTSVAATKDLSVHFNGTTSVSNSSKVTATATKGSTSASISVKDMTLNETLTATYTVVNEEEDVGASFQVTSINLSNTEYFAVTTDASSAKSIAAGGTNTITVTITMIKTPVSSSSSATTVTIGIDATPKNLITFYYSGSSYTAVDGMTWEEFINSSYNNQNQFSADDTLVKNAGTYLFYNSNYVLLTDKIVANYFYTYDDCCFDPGTKILMADGTEKNIEDVEVGDMVMSLNEETGEYIAQKVKDTIINEYSTDLVYVNLSNGVQIGMRAYHPLLTTEGWKSLRPEYAETKIDVGKVELLEVGDTLIGYKENVTIVSIEQRDHIDNYHTYNLSIEGHHNYIANGIVAHNATTCETN